MLLFHKQKLNSQLRIGQALLFSLVLILLSNGAFANFNVPNKITVSGYVTDASNGEELTGVTILVKELGVGTATNSYGFYSISLKPGTYTLVYSFVGYSTVERSVTLAQSTSLSVELSESSTFLGEVVVTSERPNSNITRAEMSVVRLDIKTIRSIPAFMGEVDVIKSIQLLPGVQSTSEGTAGFSVRGGAMDHNLILLDEATVYNASHLMGFFSVFNNDAIKDVKLYKGDIPASSGGRLASLLDVRMKDGNSKEFSATGGIGTISSRLTIEGPILSENTTFIVSGRRTYADLLLHFAPNEEIRDNQLFFYDMNMKLSHRINDNNRLYFSGYFGRDVFRNLPSEFGFGNQTFTFRWNHLFNPKLFLNTSLFFSRYDYYLGMVSADPSAFIWKSEMEDYSAKFDFNYYLNSRNTLRFGVQSTYHFISPGRAKGMGDNTIIGQVFMPNTHSLQHGVYAQNEQKITDKWVLKYGLRFSAMQNMGMAKVYEYNEDYMATGYSEYQKGEIFNTYANLEPRLGTVYTFNDNNSVKASYSRTVQYIQQASNSAAGTPLDIWFAASPNVKPQLADQWALGYFVNFLDHSIEASLEIYHKDIKNVVDFRDFANLLLNDKLEGELRIGSSKAYGMETMVNFNRGKLNGWISYTYSRVFLTVPEVNMGEPYPAFYDKPHDISFLMSYEINSKFSISGNWVYSTGVPATFPAGRYEIMGVVVPIYTKRNSYRYPDYHRLDLALTYKPGAGSSKKWKGEWNLSVYNVYNRKNAWVINFVSDRENPSITHAEKTYLFSILPSLTYNFKF